jgi:hypothetical protein
MRFKHPDAFLVPLLLPIFLIGLFPLLVLGLLGFFGIGILGLLLVSVAVGDELNATGLYAQRVITRDDVTQSERAGYGMELRSARRPAFLMKLAGAGLMIVGFGGFALFQL